MCAVFNDLGQYSSRSMALNIYIRLQVLSYNVRSTTRRVHRGSYISHGLWWVSQECYVYHFWAEQPVLCDSVGTSTEVSHFTSANRTLFRHRSSVNTKSFALCGSAVQQSWQKRLYFWQVFFLQVRGRHKTSQRGFGASFLWPLMGYSVFHKNQTTEGGYELTWGTSWAFSPGLVRLVYWYAA